MAESSIWDSVSTQCVGRMISQMFQPKLRGDNIQRRTNISIRAKGMDDSLYLDKRWQLSNY